MNTQGLSYNALVTLLRIALVLMLVVTAWSVYRFLPDESHLTDGETSAVAETTLQIVLRPSPGETRAPTNLLVKLFPIDITAAQNEFNSERRPGKRVEDFLAERMGNRSPVETRFDENGQAVVNVKSGLWWIHTTLPGVLIIEWRLRVNVSGNKQTVELTPDNAYTRSRSF